MKKRNLFLQTAIASALMVVAAGAQAGTMSGTAAFATENFGPTSTAATGIATPAIVYTFNTPGGIVVNPAGVIFAYYRVSNGIYSTAPLAGQFSTTTGLTIGTPVLSSDSTTVRVPLTNPNAVGGANITIGVGNTLTYTGIANAITNVNTVLNTASGTVSIQGSVSTTSATPNTGTATPADLDNGLSNTLVFATAKSAITAVVTPSSSLTIVETAKVDLTSSSGAGARFTTPGNTLSNVNNALVLNLGSLMFTDVAAVQRGNTANAYTTGSSTTALGLSGTVTGSFKTASTMALTTDTGCATLVTGGAGTLNAGLTTFTFAAGTTPTTGTPNYVCLTVPATTGAIPANTPAASFSVAKSASTDAATTASGNLYALTNNGATVDVRTYIPVGTIGYQSFLRVINTGTIGAAVTGQYVYQDGSFSTAAVLVTSLAASGSTTLTSTQIEAALGAPAVTAGARPRVRITAPANGLNVQSFILNTASGVFTEVSGAQ